MIPAFSNYEKSSRAEKLVNLEVVQKFSDHRTIIFTAFFLNNGIHPEEYPLSHSFMREYFCAIFLTEIQNSVIFAQNIRKSNESVARYANKHQNLHNFAIGDLV